MIVLKTLKYLFLIGCIVALGILFWACQRKEIGATEESALITGFIVGLVSMLGLVVTRIIIKQRE